MPLTEFFAPIAELAQAKGVRMVKASVEGLTERPGGGWSIRTGEETHEADAVILATNFKETHALLRSSNLNLPGDESHFTAAPITTVHLWFDREVTDLDHAVLLDTRIQWMFAKSRIRRWEPSRGSYLELVISASWPELAMSRDAILRPALAEAEMFFPKIRSAKLLKSGILKEARATFSVTPGLDQYRPAQKTEWSGLFLAGDWTRTEWPSTMEGAIRSGRLAAGAVVENTSRFMAPELPATGLMRLLSKV